MTSWLLTELDHNQENGEKFFKKIQNITSKIKSPESLLSADLKHLKAEKCPKARDILSDDICFFRILSTFVQK